MDVDDNNHQPILIHFKNRFILIQNGPRFHQSVYFDFTKKVTGNFQQKHPNIDMTLDASNQTSEQSHFQELQ